MPQTPGLIHDEGGDRSFHLAKYCPVMAERAHNNTQGENDGLLKWGFDNPPVTWDTPPSFDAQIEFSEMNSPRVQRDSSVRQQMEKWQTEGTRNSEAKRGRRVTWKMDEWMKGWWVKEKWGWELQPLLSLKWVFRLRYPLVLDTLCVIKLVYLIF